MKKLEKIQISHHMSYIIFRFSDGSERSYNTPKPYQFDRLDRLSHSYATTTCKGDVFIRPLKVEK